MPRVAASIKKPIHNVKDAARCRDRKPEGPQIRVFIPGVRHGSARTGGAYRDRTDDPLLAKQVLSQLS